MSTIIDLNTATTVNFNNQADYAIVFGANAGNATANIDAYTSANITKQTSLTSITDAVRDLLIDVQFSNVGAVSMAYTGPYSNIGLLQIAPAAWRVNGIRSVNQYDEAFANVRYSDLTGAQITSPEYSYTTTVNDQSGNTRTWTTFVDINQNPEIDITGPVIYSEDTITNVTVANVVVDPLSVVTFRLHANTIPTYGSMTDGVVTGNSIYIDGNATSLNSQIAAGAIQFLPASDLTSNVANAISFSIGNITSEFSTANANIQIANTHSEFNWSSSGTYDEDTRVAFGNTIADLDTRALSFTVEFQQTSGNVGKFYVNDVLSGNANTMLTITNSKININNSVKWQPAIDDTGNVTITYSQIKTLSSGNVLQANAVVQTLTLANTNPEISNMINRSYTSNTSSQIFANSTPYINDGPDYGQTYTITLNSSLGYFGNSAANAILSNTYSFTGNMTSTNTQFANMVFVPKLGTSSSGNFVYTQSRDGVSQVNNTLTLTGSVGPAPTATYTLSTSGTFTPAFNDYYYGQANILLVGGGGGGGGGGVGTAFFTGGGGGGGGEFKTFSVVRGGLSISSPITVGSGGTSSVTGPGSNGANTSIEIGANIYTAQGGTGGGSGTAANGGNYLGTPSYNGGTGGSFINNTTGSNVTTYVGGGGAGAGANGTNAVQINESGILYGRPGPGGNGITWTNGVTYAGGGGGSPGGSLGGAGGGGNGATNNNTGGRGSAGTNGLGGGGGGTTGQLNPGGSGVIIIQIT